MLPAAFRRKFGIEFEYGFRNIDEDGVANLISDVTGGRAQYGWEESPSFWTISHDSGGLEVRTPVMDNGRWGEIKQVLGVLRPHGYWRSSCGTHVHLDASDLDVDQRMTMVHWWVALESLMMSLVHNSRRANCYCPSINGLVFGDLYRENTGSEFRSRWNGVREQFFNQRRYLWVLQAIGRTSIAPYTAYDTIEIRLHHATLNYTRIKHWMRLMQLLVWHSKHTSLTEPEVFELRGLSDTEKLGIVAGIVRAYAGQNRSAKIMNHLNQRLVKYAG